MLVNSQFSQFQGTTPKILKDRGKFLDNHGKGQNNSARFTNLLNSEFVSIQNADATKQCLFIYFFEKQNDCII